VAGFGHGSGHAGRLIGSHEGNCEREALVAAIVESAKNSAKRSDTGASMRGLARGANLSGLHLRMSINTWRPGFASPKKKFHGLHDSRR
jgi:hypothetical protein